MDIGVYISELLTKNGEISVPGLGFLVLQKIPGYYNETDGRFYPPRATVQFDPQQINDDDTLAQYIADQKNISLSSSKYFVEKYIASIREDALVKEVHVADLGSFLADQGRLIFIPSQKPISNPAFFGLAPVNLAKTLPPPAPISTPPPAPQSNEPSFSNFTTEQRPPAYDFDRPRETNERRNIYQGNTPYPPPLDDTPASAPPPSSTPPPASPNRDRQALIDAFNANNKGAYAEQGIPPPPPHSRPDIFPPMSPLEPVANDEEEEEVQKRPIALFILVGLIVVLAAGVFALKKFMPAKYDAIKNIFSHKTVTQTADVKKGDTAIIKEPVANIPPPALDSAQRDSLKKVHARDSVIAARVADSIKKVQRADSIKNAIASIADAKKRRKDSLENVRLTKIQRAKDRQDSIKNAKAEKKRLDAAALAAKLEAKKNKTASLPVTAAPVAAPTTTQNTKTVTANVQKTVAQPASTGNLQFTPVEPGKTWFAVIGPFSATVAEARIAGLKKIGIEGFAVKKGATIFVAMGAYAKNSEADAAATKFKQSGVSEAYITQISK